MKHKHHIIPKHMGGTDDPDNIAEVSVEKHAELHKQLWEDLGDFRDYLAWQGLSNLKTKKEIFSEFGKLGTPNRKVKTNKGMKYKQYKQYKHNPNSGTLGLRWYHNPNDVYERGCFKENEQPEGWIRGQGKKKINPGLNFHAKRKRSSDGDE